MNKALRTYSPLLLILLVWLLSSCTSHRGVINETSYRQKCPDVVDFNFQKDNQITDSAKEDRLYSNYSFRSLVFADANGLIEELDLYEDYRILRKDSLEIEERLAVLEVERNMDDALDIAYLELESQEDFLDCRMFSTSRIVLELENVNCETRSVLTNSGIIVGAESAVATAYILIQDQALNDGSAKDWVGVFGGIAAALLAVELERVDKKVKIDNGKNIIACTWIGQNNTGAFSDSIWRIMNKSIGQDDLITTIRTEILEKWNVRFEEAGHESSPNYFNPSFLNEGIYSEEMLRLKLRLLEAAEHGVALLCNTLFSLNKEWNESRLHNNV